MGIAFMGAEINYLRIGWNRVVIASPLFDRFSKKGFEEIK
jgi:hypothetical protein